MATSRRPPAAHALALCLLYALALRHAHAKVVRVGGPPILPGVGGWTFAVQRTWTQPVIKAGDKLLFEWSSGFGLIKHNVALMPGKPAFRNCNFARAKVVGGNGYLTPALKKGTFYYSCSLSNGGHCRALQKVAIRVT